MGDKVDHDLTYCITSMNSASSNPIWTVTKNDPEEDAQSAVASSCIEEGSEQARSWPGKIVPCRAELGRHENSNRQQSKAIRPIAKTAFPVLPRE